MLFIASLYNDNELDVSADGSQITIIDNSNYADESGTAFSAGSGASAIQLANDASSVSDYYNGLAIEIVAGTGEGEKFNILDYNGGTKIATIDGTWVATPDDTSEYIICESGHLQSDFDEYRVITIVDYDNDTYTYSSIGDGDATVDVPSDVTTPIALIHDYATGDGRYEFTLYSVPTWQSYANYQVANYPCVYYNGKLYKSILDGEDKNPSTETNYWEEITQADLQTKYISTGNAVFICDLKQCYAQAVKLAVDVKLTTNVDIFKIDEMKRALELLLIIENIQGLVNASDWSNVDAEISKSKVICDCCA